jgi:hypothetical protein
MVFLSNIFVTNFVDRDCVEVFQVSGSQRKYCQVGFIVGGEFEKQEGLQHHFSILQHHDCCPEGLLNYYILES